MAANSHIVDSGELTKQIVLQKKTITRGNYNDPIVTRTNIATVWAKIEKTKTFSQNTEIEINKKEKITNTFVFTIRFYAGLDTRTCSIKYQDVTYDILNIYNVNQANTMLEIAAEEVV